jgi:hypothetical protein
MRCVFRGVDRGENAHGMRRKSSSWVGIEADGYAGREPLDVRSIDQLELARTVLPSPCFLYSRCLHPDPTLFQEAGERRGRETTALIIRAPQRTIC